MRYATDGLAPRLTEGESPRQGRRRGPARRIDPGSDTAPDPGAGEPLEASLRNLPVAGVSRRRLAWIAGAFVTVWVVAVFARQVGDASAAADRAAEVRAQNAAFASEVAALELERNTLRERSFVEFQARAYGLGTAKDRRFTLAANAPSLAPDAPGSASLRLGSTVDVQPPLDSWLSLLFGPSR